METFYDIHCHAMNLSHPNILALLVRNKMEKRGIRDIIFGPYSSFFLQKPAVKVRNLLSVMENDLGSFFTLMEDDLAGKYLKDDSQALLRNRILQVGERSYRKIILTPLIMDFQSSTTYDEQIHYNRPPSKPINEQIVDLLNGIKQYRKKNPEGMLEIYPFLGVNTRNYTLKQLEALLQKYFGLYRPLRNLFGNAFAGIPNLNITLPMIGPFHFAGVKLYPPLGFDPWPEGDPVEMEKVRFLYDLCMKKQIPITTHCSEAGFTIIDERTAVEYTSPQRWEKVLHEFPELKINFAHMGKQYSRKFLFFERTEWQKRVLSLLLRYPNSYTDFSFIGAFPGFYRKLLSLTERFTPSDTETVRRKILFGSDFMINLIEIDSYYEYLNRFSSSLIPSGMKHRLCSENPQKFLFG